MTVFALFLAGVAQAQTDSPQLSVVYRMHRAGPKRVLFVGNSYSFKIPKLFASIAKANKLPIEVSQVTRGGWTLTKHAADRETLETIAEGNWDIVVLQEQSQIPSFPAVERAELMDPAAKKLVDQIRDAGAIPVFFQTWGRRDGDLVNGPNDSYDKMQARLLEGYQHASEVAGNVFVVPVGQAWAKFDQKNRPDLYGKDGSHPSEQGINLGACVFYVALLNDEDFKLPERNSISPAILEAARTVKSK
ncbi:hypothetical protein GC197_11920 [bacterium]|nr:hypothetical protein [bacterium]